MPEQRKTAGVAEAPAQSEIADFMRLHLPGFSATEAMMHLTRMTQVLIRNVGATAEGHECDDCAQRLKLSVGCAGVALLSLAEEYGVNVGEAMGEAFLMLRAEL